MKLQFPKETFEELFKDTLLVREDTWESKKRHGSRRIRNLYLYDAETDLCQAPPPDLHDVTINPLNLRHSRSSTILPNLKISPPNTSNSLSKNLHNNPQQPLKTYREFHILLPPAACPIISPAAPPLFPALLPPLTRASKRQTHFPESNTKY